MLATDLVQALLHKEINGDLMGIEVKDIVYDVRKVKSGALFVAFRGNTVDGHDLLEQAKQAGAVAAVVEHVVPRAAIPQVIVPSTPKAAPILANVFYNHPTRAMKVIGVTGTNGKTTTTHLIDKILSDSGRSTGLIGTVKVKIGLEEFEVNNTTPVPLDLQRYFARMRETGTEYAIMEVSSQGLDLGRVAGVQFHTAVFTNLTQDHLDYHQTMEAYREAKGKLFSRLGNTYSSNAFDGPTAVLNADDEASKYFADQTVAQVITYGIDQPADLQACELDIQASGVSFRMKSPFGDDQFKLQMTGKFSVYNALAAAAVCLLEGVPMEQIKQSLESVRGVSGRFERVALGQPFEVIVDYAHTPDSLENVLKTVQQFVKGKIVTVVGCGGDRDRKKRPIMARIAAEYSDLTVLTSDNPRTEDPDRILDDMQNGLAGVDASNYVRIADRAEAIRFAVSSRGPEDVVLIAGKGHETYQIIGHTKTDFDDRLVAADAIRRIL